MLRRACGNVDRSKESVFDFIFVAGGDAEIGEEVAGLRGCVSAIVLEAAVAGEVAEFSGGDGRRIGLRTEGVGIGGVKTLRGIVAGLQDVGFAAAELVMPMFSGSKIPACAGTEKMLGIALVEIWRCEESLTRDAGDAVVVAEGEAELIVVAKAVTEIGGERAIEKIVVGALAVGLQVGSGARIVELAEEAAELCAAAAGSEASTFAVDAELRDARLAAVGEELDDARDGVGAVDGAFRAADDFDFVDVVESDAGKIDGSAWRIDGGAIDEDFGEIGVAAVKEDGGGAAFRAGAADGDSGSEEQRVGERDGLTGVDFVLGDDGDGCGGLVDESGLGLGGDDDAGGEALKVESEIELCVVDWRRDRGRNRA